MPNEETPSVACGQVSALWHVPCFYESVSSVKGIPYESTGRKVNGLKGLYPMTAGLPDQVIAAHVASLHGLPEHVASGLAGNTLPGIGPQTAQVVRR